MEHLMAPSLVLPTRHAEKPADTQDPHLSNEGRIRAEKLAVYIPETFGDIRLLFASAISKYSARPYETLKPLSKKLDLPIDATHADQDYAALANELLVDHQLCWSTRRYCLAPQPYTLVRERSGSRKGPVSRSMGPPRIRFDFEI
jgi:hypothetical protein